jgi:hypothetical protein
LGTADLSKAHNTETLSAADPSTVSDYFKTATATATPAPTPTVIPAIIAPEINTSAAATSIPIDTHGITCLPEFPNGTGTYYSGNTYKSIVPKLVLPTGTFKEPTILKENPFNGLKNLNSGNEMGDGGAMMVGGAGALAAKTTVAAPVATTAAGGTAAGGTIVATATTVVGGFIGNVVAPVAVGVALGYVLAHGVVIPIIDGVFYPGIGKNASPEDYRMYDANRAAIKAGASPKSFLKPKTSNNAPTPSGNPNPKKPDDEKKDRKFNQVQRTDAMRKIKENYRYDKSTKSYKLKDNGTPIKCSRTGKPVEHVSWDGAHGDIEAWKGPRSNDHMGSLDPETFIMYKGPANDGRNLL